MSTILIVEDEAALAAAIAELCRRMGHEPVTAASAMRGLRLLKSESPDLVVLDIGLPDHSGLELLQSIRKLDADLPVLIVTAHGSLQNAVEAKKQGATGYLVKPLDLVQFEETIRSLLGARPVVTESEAVPDEALNAPELIGSSPAMQPAFAAIAHACSSNVPVLISGPKGIGKSLTARIIHEQGARRAAPFVTLSCASLPESSSEVELFAHVERADGGTLFVDEIASLPLALQVKLLRVIHDGTLPSVDQQEPRTVDLRFVAATDRDLEQAAEQGEFREELLYRLRVLEVDLPPLRQRTSDLAELCAFLLAQVSEDRRLTLSEEAMSLLRAYDWPGNVHELRNALEHAAAVAGGNVVLPADLPDTLRASAAAGHNVEAGVLDQALQEWLDARLRDGCKYDDLAQELEGRLLALLLPRYEGKPTVMARALEMNRATLRRKLRNQQGDV